jgi:hypothetical protein
MSALFSPTHFTKPFKWLIFALCIKLFLYFIFILPDTNPKRKFSGPFIKSADHVEYISPIDNYIEKGIYAIGSSNEPYAGRLPGFVFPYIVFRAILNEKTANICLGIFILTLAIIASYTLGLLLFQLTKKRWAFVTGFLLINFIPYFWHYEWTLHTSSLGVSCLIFFSYYFHSYFIDGIKKHLLFAGFFFCWLLLLRGFCFVYLPFVMLFLFLLERKAGKKMKELIIAFFIFLLPLGIFESLWIGRNFISLHKFVPLQTSFVPGTESKNPEYGYQSITKYSLTKVRELIFTWGGENAWYFPDSDISWFAWKGGNNTTDLKFDESIFFDGFTKDTLIALRNEVFFSYRDNLTDQQHDSIENKIIRTSEHLKTKFKQNKTVYYYFKAPFKRLKNYLFRNVTQDWPGPSYADLTIFQKLLRFLSIGTYFVLLLQIVIFPFLYLKNRSKDKDSRFYLFFFVLLIASIFPFMYLIAMSHYTYFIFGFTTLIPIFVYNVKVLLKQ